MLEVVISFSFVICLRLLLLFICDLLEVHWVRVFSVFYSVLLVPLASGVRELQV